MQRLLVLALSLAACASGGSAGSSGSRPTAGVPAGGVCNDEVFSPRGTVGMKCYTKEQLDNQKRFSSDTKLDPTPRQTYNN